MNGNPNKEFFEHLKRFRSAWRRGLVFALVLRLAGWAVTAVAVYFVADFFLALDEVVRIGLNILLPLGLAAAVAPEAIRIARLGMREAAGRTDHIGQHRRKDVLTAWELHPADGPEKTPKEGGMRSWWTPVSLPASDRARDSAVHLEDGTLPSFLVQRSLDEATARLAVLDP
ncbi:MAG: hypothetical protein WCS01_04500, partial [bacterium]